MADFEMFQLRLDEVELFSDPLFNHNVGFAEDEEEKRKD